jgi:hypothetical protein
LTRSRPRRPSLAATTAWPAPSRRNRNVACTAWSSSTRRIFARAAALPESRQRKVESLPGRKAMRNSFGAGAGFSVVEVFRVPRANLRELAQRSR